jgi:predicted CXXCH cytochrome family protein
MIYPCGSQPIWFSRFLFPVVFILCVHVETTYSQTREECLECHADRSLTMERNGRTVPLAVNDSILAASPHAKLVCVACHTGFDKDNVPHKEHIEPVNCLACHRDALMHHAFHPQLISSGGADGMPGMSCKGCHGRHDVVSPRTPGSKFSLASSITSCGACHVGIRNEYLQSAHGKAALLDVSQAPRCLNCHRNPVSDKHRTQASDELKISQARMCLSCHDDKPEIRKAMPEAAGAVNGWFNSLHGVALQRGNALAAVCSDCHGSHTVNRASDPGSPVSRLNTPATCAKCHIDIANQYKTSVHGRLASAGRMDTPSCATCHVEHPGHGKNAVMTAPEHGNQALPCGACHPPARVLITAAVNPSYFTADKPGYHGFAMQNDSLSVTRCASCHGAHDIREKSDSASAVNAANIASTCGACHPDAQARFAGVPIHTRTDLRSSAEFDNRWIRNLYGVLLIVFVGWRVLVNLLDCGKRARRRELNPPLPPGGEQYERLSKCHRSIHWMMICGFAILIVSGLAIHFPHSVIVEKLTGIMPFISAVFKPAHHLGVGLIALVMISHVLQLVILHKGRVFLKDMLPARGDFHDTIKYWKWCFGRCDTIPEFGRFAPFEKSNYWFTVAGVLIIAVTGFCLGKQGYFTEQTMGMIRSIHFYQSMLTTISLIAGHIYNNVFNPDVYPLNRAMIDGMMSEEKMRLLHAREVYKDEREQ